MFQGAWERKVDGLLAMYQHHAVQVLWKEFGLWVSATGRTSKALARTAEYAEALAKIDRALTEGVQIDAEFVARTLNAESLRRAGLMAQFFAATGRILADATSRAQQSDQRRIEQMVRETEKQIWHAHVATFAEYLHTAMPVLSLHTQRLYLRAAVGFLHFANTSSVGSLNDSHVTAFLRKTPGQRNSLWAFLRHLRERERVVLTLPKAKRPRPAGVAMVAREVASLLETISAGQRSRQTQLAALAKCISLIYAVPLQDVLALRMRDLAVDYETGVEFRLRGDWIRVDSRLEGWARWLLVDMAMEHNADRRLFPGRLSGDAISVSAVSHHLKKSRSLTI